LKWICGISPGTYERFLSVAIGKIDTADTAVFSMRTVSRPASVVIGVENVARWIAPIAAVMSDGTASLLTTMISRR